MTTEATRQRVLSVWMESIDSVAAEVVETFRDRDIPSILLKGPALAALLYREGDPPRTYGDSDLLVPPDRAEEAEAVLRKLGFELMGEQRPRSKPAHSKEWLRERDRAVVDLHVTIWRVGLEPEALWERLAQRTEKMSVGGTTMNVLTPAARALMLTLHAAHHGPETRKPLGDLALAIERVPDQMWMEAAELAAELRASRNLALGLNLLPEGAALAERLGFHDAVPSGLAAAGRIAPLADGIERFAATPTLAAKARLVRREVFPPADFLRWWLPMARRGRPWLVAAYGYRVAWLIRQLPPSLKVWRKRHRA